MVELELGIVDEFLRKKHQEFKKNPKSAVNYSGASVSGPRRQIMDGLIREAVDRGARNMLEIGTFRGATTLRALAMGVEQVDTVNPVKGEILDAIKLWKDFHVWDRVRPLTVDSLEFLMASQGAPYDKPDYDIVLIDGRHTYAYAMGETLALLPRTRMLMMWDDMSRTSGNAMKNPGEGDLIRMSRVMHRLFPAGRVPFHYQEKDHFGWAWLNA